MVYILAMTASNYSIYINIRDQGNALKISQSRASFKRAWDMLLMKPKEHIGSTCSQTGEFPVYEVLTIRFRARQAQG